MSDKNAPAIAESNQEIDEKDRWRVLLPGAWGDNAIFLIHFCGWLLALSFIEEASPELQAFFIPAWLVAFLLIYARSTARYPTRAAAASLGLRFPLRIIPYAFSLWTLTGLSMPWAQRIVWNRCVVNQSSVATSPLVDVGLRSIAVTSAMVYACYLVTYPLLEEFFARGWVLGYFRERGTTKAVVISATMFSFLHLNTYPPMFATYFVLGVMLAYSVIATGSIWTAVGMHVVWNSVATIAQTPRTDSLIGHPLAFVGADCRYSWLYLISVVAIAVSVLHVAVKRRIAQRNTPENASSRE